MRRLAWLLAALTALPAWAGETLFARTTGDLAAEVQAARAEGRPLAVEVVLSDCPACAEMKRTTLGDRRAGEDFGRRYRHVSVLLDGPEAFVGPRGEATTRVAWARQYGVAATPSFVFFDKEGKLAYRHVGALPDAEALNLLGRFVAAAAYDDEPFSEYRRRFGRAPLFTPVDAEARFDAGVRALPLTDQAGRARSLADFAGRTVLLAFGYTACADVCPTTLAELAELRRQLGSRGREIQVVFVTLDPERDTRRVLAAYVPAFDPSFIALRGDRRRTDRLIEAFGLVAEKRPGAGNTYTLDHTAGVYVIDAAGRLRGRAEYGQPVAELVREVRKLLAEKPAAKAADAASPHPAPSPRRGEGAPRHTPRPFGEKGRG